MGGGYVTPNVCYVDEVKGMKFNPYIPPPLAMAGDVAYWDGSKVKTTPLSNWNTSLGTPVGVVVVPEGFAPDGRVRIVSLMGVDENGNKTNSHVSMRWAQSTANKNLTKYTKVSTTDNAGSTSTGSDDDGCLPSDNFTGIQSFVDPKAKYASQAEYMYSLIPSPYLGEGPNPEYYKTLDGGNILSDFNGLSNTQSTVNLGTGYTATRACWRYNDGASNLRWYLPAMGELCYFVPRCDKINNTLAALGGLEFFIGDDINFIESYETFWSSTFNGETEYYLLKGFMGHTGDSIFHLDYYVRPFAMI